MAKDFHELVIWQRSHQLTLEIYRMTQAFPQSEQFGLADQMRRAAVSIPSNIAEGFGRDTKKDFKYFLVVARGSLSELQAQVLIAKDLGLMTNARHDQLYTESVEIHKMLNKFISTLKLVD